MIKLPKQWSQWMYKAGLKPASSTKMRGEARLMYMRGKGRWWRVNCLGHFECSEKIYDFDRWANSRAGAYMKIPASQQEFIAAVRALNAASGDVIIIDPNKE